MPLLCLLLLTLVGCADEGEGSISGQGTGLVVPWVVVAGVVAAFLLVRRRR